MVIYGPDGRQLFYKALQRTPPHTHTHTHTHQCVRLKMYNNTLYPFENEFVNMKTHEYAIKRIHIFQFSFIAEPHLDCETMRESILSFLYHVMIISQRMNNIDIGLCQYYSVH